MAARSSPGGFVVATVTNPGSFMATITHPTGNGYYPDRILRDRPISFLADQAVMSLTAISFEVQRLWSVWPLNNVQVTVLCPL